VGVRVPPSAPIPLRYPLLMKGLVISELCSFSISYPGSQKTDPKSPVSASQEFIRNLPVFQYLRQPVLADLAYPKHLKENVEHLLR
jgi:hypothetical protein